MMIKQLCVKSFSKIFLITRPQEDAERTASSLQKHGINVFVEPLMKVEEIKFQEKNLPDNIQAVIFTGSNGVRSFAKQTTTKNLRIIAVGEKTAQTAKLHNFNHIESAGGNADHLVSYIKKFCCPNQGAIIYARAQEVSQDIAKKLRDFDLQHIVVYKTNAISHLSTQCLNILKSSQLSGVLFYSAKTALTFKKLLTTHNITDTTNNLIAYSLSAKIDEKISCLKWKKRIVSLQEEQMIDEILKEAETRY